MMDVQSSMLLISMLVMLIGTAVWAMHKVITV